MPTVLNHDRQVDGTVRCVDRKSGIATVAYNGARSVEVFLPAFFGGQFAPYPNEGTLLHMCIVDPGIGSPQVVEAWAD